MQNSTPIPYAQPRTKAVKTDRAAAPWGILILTLTALAVFTAIHIEILNAQAGDYLPRNLFIESGRWRESLSDAKTTCELKWLLMGVPLTPEDIARKNAAIARAIKKDTLLNAVSTIGLLQYPVASFLIVAAPLLLFRFKNLKWKAAMATCTFLAIACTLLMFLRAYYPSLGW